MQGFTKLLLVSQQLLEIPDHIKKMHRGGGQNHNDLATQRNVVVD